MRQSQKASYRDAAAKLTGSVHNIGAGGNSRSSGRATCTNYYGCVEGDSHAQAMQSVKRGAQAYDKKTVVI